MQSNRFNPLGDPPVTNQGYRLQPQSMGDSALIAQQVSSFSQSASLNSIGESFED
jgi:hypothetical protein